MYTAAGQELLEIVLWRGKRTRHRVGPEWSPGSHFLAV